MQIFMQEKKKYILSPNLYKCKYKLKKEEIH